MNERLTEGLDALMADKTCGTCGEQVIYGKPDPCLGLLPGVTNACCGHGGGGYIQFANGVVVRFPLMATERGARCSDPQCPDRITGEAKVIVRGQVAHGWTWGHCHYPWGETLQQVQPPEEGS